MSLQIKVGHRYSTRSGDVVEILSNDGHEIWPFVGEFISGHRSGHITCFSKDGRWIMEEGGESDLIEELPGDDRCEFLQKLEANGLTEDEYWQSVQNNQETMRSGIC